MLRSVWRTPSPTVISRSAPLSTGTPWANSPRIKPRNCSPNWRAGRGARRRRAREYTHPTRFCGKQTSLLIELERGEDAVSVGEVERARGASRSARQVTTAPGVRQWPKPRLCPDADHRTLALHGHRPGDRQAPADDLPVDYRGSARPVRGPRADAIRSLAIRCLRRIERGGDQLFKRHPARMLDRLPWLPQERPPSPRSSVRQEGSGSGC
jgi:hypothetical protein